MQKKLIALAVAGLVSAPAFAQSNVTIYGVADAGVAVGTHGDNQLRGVASGVLSGSRLGFRGTEDLGNGLKAVFQLEQGFDIGNGVANPQVGPTNNRDSVFSRQAWVGLQGAFGTVGLGRQYAPGFGQHYDALASSVVLGPQGILSTGASLTINPGSAARWDNSVTYSNTFANVLKVNAIYSAQTRETDNDDATNFSHPDNDNAWGVGVEYANAGLRAGVVYHALKDGTNLGDNQREWMVGASYNFGMATVAGSYQAGKDVGQPDSDVKLWQIGAIVPVSAAGNVHIAYGRAEVETTGVARDNEPTSWGVAYLHALSKRTTGYVGFNRTNNDSGFANFGPVAAQRTAADAVLAGEDGKNSSIFALGVRHTF